MSERETKREVCQLRLGRIRNVSTPEHPGLQNSLTDFENQRAGKNEIIMMSTLY